jgi:hypothetical protein
MYSVSKKKSLPTQAERAKRSAAGGAKSTAGRSRVFKDKKTYDRKKGFEMDSDTFASRMQEILKDTPVEFHGSMIYYAYQGGNSVGDDEVFLILEDLCEMVRRPIFDFKNRVIQEENNKRAAE